MLLANERVDVNCQDFSQITPLIMAASRADKIEIFKLFLAEERVDVNLVSPKDDISVLMCSV